MENFTHKKFTLNESNTIKRIMNHKLGGLLNEQDNDFLEKSYVKPKIEDGYKVVDKINLPDGTYSKGGSGYGVVVQDNGENETGYYVVVNNGIRGMWSGQFKIIGGKPELDVYKILFKKGEFKPETQENKEIKTITNKIKSEGIKNVSNDMITSPQFKGDYSGYNFGGEFKGVNYRWDASGVEGMSGVRGFVEGEIISEKNSSLSKYNIEDADPSGVWVGFYDGSSMAFACYMTNSGGAKCKNLI